MSDEKLGRPVGAGRGPISKRQTLPERSTVNRVPGAAVKTSTTMGSSFPPSPGLKRAACQTALVVAGVEPLVAKVRCCIGTGISREKWNRRRLGEVGMEVARSQVRSLRRSWSAPARAVTNLRKRAGEAEAEGAHHKNVVITIVFLLQISCSSRKKRSSPNCWLIFICAIKTPRVL